MPTPQDNNSSSIPKWSSVSNTCTTSVQNETHPSEQAHQRSGNHVMAGAAIAGGVIGLAVAGPLLGVVAGTAAALASTQSGTVGDITRASGNVVIAAGERAKDVNEKHHVAEKTKNFAEKTVEQVKKFEEKHHIIDKTKTVAGSIAQKAKEFDDKHHIVEKTTHGIVSGANYIATKINPKNKD